MLVDGYARADWRYFFNLASGAQGWQREDAEQEAGEGFPAPRFVPSLARKCGRRRGICLAPKGLLRNDLAKALKEGVSARKASEGLSQAKAVESAACTKQTDAESGRGVRGVWTEASRTNPC